MPPSSLAYNELLFLCYFGCQFLPKPPKKEEEIKQTHYKQVLWCCQDFWTR